MNLNQMSMTGEVGDLDLSMCSGENVFSCLFDPTDTTNELYPGEGVTLKDLGGDDQIGVPIVGIRATENAAIFGVLKRNSAQATKKGGQVCEIAAAGSVVRMKAAAALNRGVGVTLVLASPGQVKAVGDFAHFGITLDKAAKGDLVRVLIQADGVTVGTAT